MSDVDEILPVIPVLAYANPQAAQPANGRLQVEFHENGVTITDPKPIATSPALIKGVGAALVVIGLGIAIALAWAGHISDGHFAAAVAAVICGAIAFFRAPTKQKPHTVRVELNRVCTSGCPEHDWISGRFVPKRIVMVKTSSDIWTMQHLCLIRVRYNFGVGFTLFQHLSPDEGIWVVDLLNKALTNDPSTSQTEDHR